HGDTGSLVEFAVCFGHVGSSAFVAADDVFDRGISESIEDIQIRFTRDRVHAFNSVRYQRVNDDVSSRFLLTVTIEWITHEIVLLDLNTLRSAQSPLTYEQALTFIKYQPW